MRIPSRILLVATVVAIFAAPLAAQDQDAPFAHIDPNERITLNFKNEDLDNILELFSTAYELNIVAGPNVSGQVTLNLYEAPVKEAFQQILAVNGYTYTVEGNFLILSTAENPETPTLEPGAGTGTPLPPPIPVYSPEVIYLNYLRAEDTVLMLDPIRMPGESIVAGPASNPGIDIDEADLGGNGHAAREMIVVFASEDTLNKIFTFLRDIDIPPPQVLVEATILSVNLDSSSVLGVDFKALGGIDFQALGGGTDVFTGVTTGTTGGGQLEDWLMGVSQNGFTDPGSAGLHVGILRNQVGMFVSALETMGNVTIKSSPKVVTLNRHAAQVLVGRKIGYQTVTATETTTVQNVQFLEVGTSLVFRPYVTEDGHVRMEIKPKSSDGVISAATGLPEESTTEVSTNVMVKSGNTIVIGGLMESQITTDVSQVPFLGTLPVIGPLFRKEEQNEIKNEIIVLLTPHIVTDEDLAGQAEKSRQRMEAAVASLASSHHGYIRPSLARRMYAEAASALATGNVSKALAKAEFGLVAMPSDPDLAALAQHCQEELEAKDIETQELQEAIELLNRVNREDI